jgi:hypothetical protein
LAVKPCSHAVVGEFRLVPYKSAINGIVTERAIVFDRILHDQTLAVCVRIEGSEVRRKALGKHREDAGRSVDGGGVVRGMRIDRSRFLDERVDIGNGDENLYSSILHLFGNRKLIEVPRLVIVDGTPKKAAEVPDIWSD